MLRYLVKRLLLAAVTTLGVATIVFISMRLVPGGFAQALVGANAARSPEIVEAIEERFGLDKPVIVQYWYWLRNAVKGDFGDSLRMNTPVSDEIVRRLKVTLELTGLATLMSIVVGVPAGVFAALRRNSIGDVAIRLFSLAGLSVPDFVLGTLLIFSVARWHLGLPVSGYVTISDDAIQHFKGMLLPTVTLGIITTSVVTRVTRSSVIEVLNEPYVVTARAKGLGPRVVAIRHVLRAALIPTVTIVGINTGYLLGGAVIVEELFSLPGLGRYALTGILNRDYPVAQGTIIVGAMLFIAANLIADLTYAFLDPRIKY
jgi:peptide/nickel transport system permease protein